MFFRLLHLDVILIEGLTLQVKRKNANEDGEKSIKDQGDETD